MGLAAVPQGCVPLGWRALECRDLLEGGADNGPSAASHFCPTCHTLGPARTAHMVSRGRMAAPKASPKVSSEKRVDTDARPLAATFVLGRGEAVMLRAGTPPLVG